MTTLTPGVRAPGPVINGFAGRLLRIDGIVRAGAVILTPEAVLDWDGADLEAAAIDSSPEFILYGTGASLVRPAPALIAAFEARGIGIEAMDTRAAARTWGVLRAEERRITAALLPL
ncbi:MAG: MTH938/NDUFAF3 family protein [Sphingomonadaceae bacterium]